MPSNLVDLNDDCAINKQNICIVQKIPPRNPDYANSYKIIFVGGTFCEFDSNLGFAELKELCNT